MDARTVAAGVLHDVLEDTEVSKDEIRERFGKDVEMLVNGVTKIDILHAKTKSVQEAETIRKMFFAMIKDIRVILIKLADKVHNMSTLEHLPPHKIRRIATECLDIYAPLAGRLGMSTVKSRLEDLALKHLDKASYYQLKDFVATKQHERESYLEAMEQALKTEAANVGITITIETRAKHFYSIYAKQKKKGNTLEGIHDILGIRVFCDDDTDCYTLLGLCHKLWKPIEGRFKDYIAMPKDNGYQSLHTTVMANNGQKTEIQIRTYAMHQTAEFGVAAHWVYKRGGKVKAETLAIVKKMKSWRSQPMGSRDFLEDIKRELLKDTIYVFTPKGKVVELPKGSTAIDFSYAIHTEVGHHTIAAKADGNIIPLGEELKNTQTVEILTNPNASPHINWLRQVRTHRARSKIRHWLNHHDEHFLIDKSIVAKKKHIEAKGRIPSLRIKKRRTHKKSKSDGKNRDSNGR
jgi:guanosine-3',5'-bis(diphosphate) 3'-pyrophosphohydrolase